MKGAHCDSPDGALASQPFLQPLAKLGGSQIGKGYGGNLRGANPQIADQMGNAGHKGFGFAGTGSGDYRDSRFGGVYGSCLLLVEKLRAFACG